MTAGRLAVLLSALEAEPAELVQRVGITGDAVIVNQAHAESSQVIATRDGEATIVTSSQRGVGVSRNLALMHCGTDVCLFADDDVAYRPDYERIVMRAFLERPDADAIVFNLDSSGERELRQIVKSGRVGRSAVRFGAPRIAARTAALRQHRITFSELFGGGAIHSAGEDSLFMSDCMRAGLKIYQAAESLGKISFEESTWFRGFDDKYLYDRGALYASMSPSWYSFYSVAFILKHGRKFGTSRARGLALMLDGARKIGTPFEGART